MRRGPPSRRPAPCARAGHGNAKRKALPRWHTGAHAQTGKPFTPTSRAQSELDQLVHRTGCIAG